MKFKIKYLFLLIPLIFTIGFSSWIIMYSFEFSPSYVKNSVSPLFDLNNPYTYDGNQHLPYLLKYKNVSEKDYECEFFSYSYKIKDSNDKYTEVLFNEDGIPTNAPVNCGEYEVIITATDYVIEGEPEPINGKCRVMLSIEKKKIKLANDLIEANYGTSTSSTTLQPIWQYGVQPYLEGKIKFNDSNNQSIDLSSYNVAVKVNGMNNGFYYYGETVLGMSSPKNVAGSTYIVNYTLNGTNASNFEITGRSEVYFKYKTINFNNIFYTIEDFITNELTKSEDITFLGNASSSTSYVETCFTKITDANNNPYYKSFVFDIDSRTMVVPFENSLSDHTITANNYTSYVYSALTIPSGITLNFNSSTLSVGAYITTGTPNATIVNQRGVILNNGTINLNGSTKLNSYGYIKGAGTVNVNSGSTVLETMRMFDFPGGSASFKSYGKVFPTNAWSLHNISCNLDIYNGGMLQGYCYLNISGAGDLQKTFDIIGKNTSQQCLFLPTGSSNKHYIRKYAINADNCAKENTNDLVNINGSNQTKGQKDIIEIHGDYKDSSLSVEIAKVILLGTIALQTSKNVALPLGYMDVIICDEASLSLSNSDYLFLPGTSVIVNDGGYVYIGAGVDITFTSLNEVAKHTGDRDFSVHYIVDTVDSKFIINGQVDCDGLIGGKILSEVKNATLNITTSLNENQQFVSSYTSIFATSGDVYYSASLAPIGNILSNDNTSFEVKPYVCDEVNGSLTWTVASKVEYAYINYYDDKTLLLTKRVTLVNNHEFIFKGGYTPEKKYHSFEAWVDKNGNAVEDTLIETNTIDVYATWSLISYSFNYIFAKQNSDGSLDILFDDPDVYIDYDESLSFTYIEIQENPININAVATYPNMYFNGWYIGNDINNITEINNTLTFEQFNTLSDLSNDKINLYCIFSNVTTIRVNFIYGLDESILAKYGVVEKYIDIKSSETLTLPNTDDFLTNNNAFNQYLVDWYYSSSKLNGTEVYNDLSIAVLINLAGLSDNNSISLYAAWAEKEIKINYFDLSKKIISENTQYARPGDYIPLKGAKVQSSTGNATDAGNKKTNYTFKYWETATGEEVGVAPDIINIEEYGNTDLDLYANYFKDYECTLTIEISGGSTLKIGETSYTSNTTIKYTYDENTNPSSVSYVATDGDGINSFTIDNSNAETSGTIKMDCNHTIDVKGKTGGCLVSGTLITMADGSKKKVEDLIVGDKVLSYNHFEGKFEVVPLIVNAHTCDDKIFTEVLNLIFSNGSELRIVNNHGLFDITLNKYIYIDTNNVLDFIGHAFYASSYSENSYSDASITLENYFITEEYLNVYSPVTYYNMNLFANDILTFPTDVNGNIFKFSKNLKYDTQDISDSISKYGLFTYEDFKDYISYEVYLAFPMKYYKIAIGKELDTFEGIISLLMTYLL